jgi:hypothetical protein
MRTVFAIFASALLLSSCGTADKTAQANFTVSNADMASAYSAGVRVVAEDEGQVLTSDATGGTFFATVKNLNVSFAVFKAPSGLVNGTIRVSGGTIGFVPISAFVPEPGPALDNFLKEYERYISISKVKKRNDSSTTIGPFKLE